MFTALLCCLSKPQRGKASTSTTGGPDSCLAQILPAVTMTLSLHIPLSSVLLPLVSARLTHLWDFPYTTQCEDKIIKHFKKVITEY